MGMRKAAVAGALAGIFTASGALSDEALQDRIAKARDRVYPALVHINAVHAEYAQGREVRQPINGSGVIVSPEGHVLTNHHVAGRAKKLVCSLWNKEEIEADLVGTDPMCDIAVIKLRLKARKAGAPPLPVARVGDSDRLQVGDYVLAMGSPLGRSNSVTLGIVSNNRRIHHMGAMEGEPVGTMLLWIQHDALILPGNSGGPLVNLEGDVIGINESIASAGGGGALGFAVPANAAREVMRQIIADPEGRVRRAWLGLAVQPLLAEMRQKGIEKGALVSSVVKGSPAAEAGLEPGDRILRIGAQETNVLVAEEIPPLLQRIAGLPIGQEVELSVARGAAARTVRMKAVSLERPLGEEEEFRRWGLTAREITEAMARELRLPAGEGAFLTGIRLGGAFGTGKPALSPGDVLVSADGKPVKDLPALAGILREAREAKKESLLLELRRGATSVLAVIDAREKEEKREGRDIPKAWLGCAVQVLTPDLERALGLSAGGGVRLTQVYPESPAESAGLAQGDIVTLLDGEPVRLTREGEADTFLQMIKQRGIGTEVELGYLRGGQPGTCKATLAPSPVPPKDVARYRDRDFELVARDLAFEDRVRMQLEKEASGCVIESVEPSGWAGWAGLRPGDLIQRVGEARVGDVAALKREMERIAKERPAHAVFRIQRGSASFFVDVEPEWNGE